MSNTHTILVLENQYRHFFTISDVLTKNRYNVIPGDLVAYRKLMSMVSIVLDLRYPSNRRNDALLMLSGYINNSRCDLLIIDYKLCSYCNGKSGALLPIELQTLTNPFPYPVIFLSGVNQSTENVMTERKALEEEKAIKHSWISKGYYGRNLNENDYLANNLIPEVRKYLNKDINEALLVHLDELLAAQRWTSYYRMFSLVKQEYSLKKDFSDEQARIIEMAIKVKNLEIQMSDFDDHLRKTKYKK